MVKKAVILAGGKGTRLRPASYVIPKELFPLINTPVIEFVIDELLVPDIEEIIIVTQKEKKLLKDYILNFAIEKIKSIQPEINLHFILQKKGIYGSGAGLLSAEKYVGNEAFLVVFADSFGLRKDKRIAELLKAYNTLHSPVISMIPITQDKLSLYGIPVTEPYKGNIIFVKRIDEKPGESSEHPLFGAPGGYILPPEIFSILHETALDKKGELSLPDAINTLALQEKVYGVKFYGQFFETGNRNDIVKTQVELLKLRD